MEHNELLKRLGLSDKESKVYLALLSAGSCNISDISKHSGVPRPAIYRVIPFLQKRELITETIRGRRTFYAATHPDKLLHLIDDATEDLHAVLPDLTSKYTAKGSSPIVRVLHGKDGIRSIFHDLVTTLKKGETFYRYSAPNDVRDVEKYLPRDYRAIRDAKKLERLVITSESIKGTKRPRLERGIKILPAKSEFDFNTTQIIYGDKIAFIDYSAEIGLVIENARLANFHKTIFLALYKTLA